MSAILSRCGHVMTVSITSSHFIRIFGQDRIPAPKARHSRSRTNGAQEKDEQEKPIRTAVSVAAAAAAQEFCVDLSP
ncbi:hypothetical protein ACIRG5_25210 [Lentzea sp. NPDC102401]|uniref:hypothetical protein n=1 Tax=Lentzea sp. NPDC102401 TaxID=3364128 RepID=UPI00380E8941